MHADVEWPNGMEGGWVLGDRAGNVKADQIVQHVYRLRDGLVAAMEIRKP